jgi:hypothetical protein
MNTHGILFLVFFIIDLVEQEMRLNKNSTLKHSISLKTGDKLRICLAENSKGK